MYETVEEAVEGVLQGGEVDRQGHKQSWFKVRRREEEEEEGEGGGRGRRRRHFHPLMARHDALLSPQPPPSS